MAFIINRKREICLVLHYCARQRGGNYGPLNLGSGICNTFPLRLRAFQIEYMNSFEK